MDVPLRLFFLGLVGVGCVLESFAQVRNVLVVLA